MLRKVVHRIAYGTLWFLPRVLAHKIIYRLETGKKLNLKEPKDFNEKIQWLIVYVYGRREAKLADKERVKGYVRKLNIPGLFIPKTIKVYKKSEDIVFSELPEKFVLKCNHSSGDVFICDNKVSIDIAVLRKRLSEKLKENLAKKTLEYHYSHIRPLIMAEEYMDDGERKNPNDYKFYVFNGRCDRILVCSEREKKLCLDDYDRNWQYLDDTLLEYRSRKKIKKPKDLDKMIRIAESLCKKDGKVVIPFARVDLYSIKGKIYFGEYTFTPARGLIEYYNQDALDALGAKIDLSLYKKSVS